MAVGHAYVPAQVILGGLGNCMVKKNIFEGNPYYLTIFLMCPTPHSINVVFYFHHLEATHIV